ncbi:MAG: ABC transporter ATP-binding protein [Mogibacterium sp.]|nr:ABC transporter ATP-binding protein [Mogibacterium sp.]
MDKATLKYFKTIGQVHQAVNRSTTLDEALHEGLGVILDCAGADCAIVWYYDRSDNKMHPYYWLCPCDLTSQEYEAGAGCVGRAYANNEAVRMLEYRKGMDPDTDRIFNTVSGSDTGSGLDISAVIVAPFGDAQDSMGCIQFLYLDGRHATEEEADVCEIMTMMVAMSIQDSDHIEMPYVKHEILLSARDITREYQNGETVTRVLKGASIDVYKGESLAVLGESGCGKSTLLNIIGGLDKATSGSFSFMGKDMTNATQEELTKYRRDNIGFIFQSYNLMTNLSARQNLDLIGELVDDPMSSEEALKLVRLEDRMDNYPSQLSGGQQQRVSIARALIKKPQMIFADEPTAALDYETSIEVLKVLENVIADGTTLLMVTHNTEITRMADRVVKIRDGRTYEVTVNRHRVKAADLVW